MTVYIDSKCLFCTTSVLSSITKSTLLVYHQLGTLRNSVYIYTDITAETSILTGFT